MMRMLAITACFAMLLPQTGCLYEDRDECDLKSILYVVVETGSEDYGDVSDGATLFLFNSDRTYLSSVEVSAEDIANNVAVPVEYGRDNLPWAVVWGNLGDSERISPQTVGAVMESMLVSMQEGGDGYAAVPDNLFYGMKQLAGNAEEYVAITPKTGRIAISVRGLPGDAAGDYYFTVATPYGSYDFAGTPLPGGATINVPYSPAVTAVHNMFHFPPAGTEGESLAVSFYMRNTETGEGLLLATAGGSASGQPIMIYRERTTNVLIDLTNAGSTDIAVVITDWDDIYQWGVW